MPYLRCTEEECRLRFPAASGFEDQCPECGAPPDSLPLLDLIAGDAPLPPPIPPLEVPLLDDSGRQLDKLEGGGSCENEIKTIAATRGVLKALIPSIRGVKIRFEAAKD